VTAERLVELAPLAALGALDGEDRSSFERELLTSPALAAELAAFEELVGRLARETAPVPPPPAVRRRVLEAAGPRPGARGAESSALARALGCRVQSNLYVADGTDPGFGKHADSMDVLAMQIEGRKRWLLFDPEATDRVIADITLTAGRALYVPARTPHLVTPLGERSMHASMSAVRPKLADYLSWSAGSAGEVDLADGDGLRRALEQMACADAIARFLDQFPQDSLEA